MEIIYQVMHLDTEGGPFVAGGNGMYINAIMACQAESLEINEKVALVLPAYHPFGQPFPTKKKNKITFDANIYKHDELNHNLPIKEEVNITVWREEKGNNEYFYIEPDKNHSNYFATAVDKQGKTLGIRTIPIELTPEQNKLKNRIKSLEDKLFRDDFSTEYCVRARLLEEPFSLKETIQGIKNYAQCRCDIHHAYTALANIYDGSGIKEVSLFMRNAHFHDISAAFITYWSGKYKIHVMHSHDYGNTACYIDPSKAKKMVKINTFHSDPGKGILPYYIKEQLGEGATQRGHGMSAHHMIYAVSKDYEEWLKNGEYSNSHYTNSMADRGQIRHVVSVPDMALHGFHAMLPFIAGYSSKAVFEKMSVSEKKKLAKEILCDKLLEINPNFAFDPQRRTILFISRISPDKGCHLIKNVIQFSLEKDCNVIICGFAGYAGAEDLIENLRKSYPTVPIIIGLENQGKLGCLHRAASDIGVGLSFQEAFGLVYSEYLCYGSFGVISDVGGSREAALSREDCSLMFPILKGGIEEYRKVQIELCHRKTSKEREERLEEEKKKNANLDMIKASKIEVLSKQIDENMKKSKKFSISPSVIYEKVEPIKVKLIELCDEILKGGNIEKETHELSKCEKQLNDYEIKNRNCNQISIEHTGKVLNKALETALARITNEPELPEHIVSQISKRSRTVWKKEIDDVYRDGKEKEKTYSFFRSQKFRRELKTRSESLLSSSKNLA